jgi:hypothetical protein
MDLEHSAADLEQLTVVPEQPTVELDQYRWLFATVKGERDAAIHMGLARYKSASQSFQQACELQTVCMTSCINYLSDLARYLGVGPKDLAEEVWTLKRQNEEAMKAAAEGQRTQAKQERLRELEARNREMEKALTLMGELLQQHTSRWATACVMLEKLEDMASPSIFVGGQVFLRGLQNQQPP